MTKILKKLEKNLKYDSKTVIHYTQKLIDTYTAEYYRDINYCRADLTRHLILLKAVDRKSTRLNSSHSQQSRMPSSA